MWIIQARPADKADLHDQIVLAWANDKDETGECDIRQLESDWRRATGVDSVANVIPAVHRWLVKNIRLFGYADDTAVLFRAKNPRHITSLLQQEAEYLKECFSLWRLPINPRKSTVLFLFRRTRKTVNHLSIYNTPILWSQTKKYLDITLNKRRPLQKCQDSPGLHQGSYPFLNQRSVFSPKNKIRLYQMILRPAMTYAVRIWA